MKRIPAAVLIATRNLGKVREIRDLVKGLSLEFFSLDDFPGAPEVEEDGATFEENALKKARITAEAVGMITVADDSGLVVDALDGRPGVFSARYSGANATDEERCLRILGEMKDVPDELRTARFVCVIALAAPNGEEHLFRGTCEGKIIRELRGTQGFGYDPIFLFEDGGLTFAEMDRAAKNLVSHRGRALKQFAEFLRTLSPS